MSRSTPPTPTAWSSARSARYRSTQRYDLSRVAGGSEVTASIVVRGGSGLNRPAARDGHARAARSRSARSRRGPYRAGGRGRFPARVRVNPIAQMRPTCSYFLKPTFGIEPKTSSLQVGPFAGQLPWIPAIQAVCFYLAQVRIAEFGTYLGARPRVGGAARGGLREEREAPDPEPVGLDLRRRSRRRGHRRSRAGSRSGALPARWVDVVFRGGTGSRMAAWCAAGRGGCRSRCRRRRRSGLRWRRARRPECRRRPGARTDERVLRHGRRWPNCSATRRESALSIRTLNRRVRGAAHAPELPQPRI